MIILIPLLLLIQVVWGEKWAFYHERSVKVFQPPTTLQEDSYFGFSTAYNWYNKRMFISAPRENNIGDVYECDLAEANKKSCSKITRHITRDAPLYTHDYWFGATIKTGPTFIVVCTPRYARNWHQFQDVRIFIFLVRYYRKISDQNTEFYVFIDLETKRKNEQLIGTQIPQGFKDAGTYGRCYRRKMNNTEFDEAKYPTTPSGAPLFQHQELIMDTLGWSLDIADDGAMIVGGPGLFNKTGTAAVLGAKLSLLKRINYVQSNLFNFGYSVAIGYFTNEEKVSFAISTTYGDIGFGQVYFYNTIYDKSAMKLNKMVDTDVVGSMFGAVLCTAKMNTHKKGNDLLVGAPAYALQSGYNTGAVYVYGYDRRGSPPTYRNKIVGQKPGSKFGSAIIRVGDLNDDGRDEIAIGAPFEDDGAVYLYSGADLLRDKHVTWLQKIKPSGTDIKSFGHSLAALKDYDDNGCNELAVSAPYKDKVMLYSCLAAVTITKLYTHFPNVKNRTLAHQTDFVFQVCMDVKYPEKPKDIIGDLSTEVTMEHPYARLKNRDHNNVYTFKTQLQTKQPTYCQNINFILPLDKDYSLEINYKIQTKLLNSPLELDKVSGAHIILSDHSELSYSDSFWAGECSGADECISNLSLTITSDITNKPFITGSLAKGKFDISVLNTGEVAYDPCIQFDIKGAGLQITPMYCTNDRSLEETWKCNTMVPIKTNSSWEIKDITVDLQGLTNQDKEVTFNVKLFDRCANLNQSKSYTHSIPLKSISDGVSIKGSTDVGDIVQILEKDISFSKHFEQIYTITNRGPSNFKGLTSTIRLQKTEFITYSDAPISIRTDATTKSKEISRKCRINTNNDVEIVATCAIDSLFKENHVRVMISLNTNPNFLTYDKLKNEDNLEVKSIMTIHIDEDKPKSFSLTTIVRLREAYVALWIWIVAGLVGLLLIIILAWVLYKYGFLRRENKKKLADLKKDIKRQTVRQSMRRPPTGDTNQILENMEEADECPDSHVNPQNVSVPPANNETAPK